MEIKKYENLRFVVNRDYSFEERVAACGCQENPDIIEENVIGGCAGSIGVGEYELTAKLVRLKGCFATIQDEEGRSLSVVEDSNLSLANPTESLAFGKAFPDIQKEIAIILLGFKVRVLGKPYCAVLTRSNYGRELDLIWTISDCCESHLFLVVNK